MYHFNCLFFQKKIDFLIYSHPQTDCIVVSQLFSVVRQVGRLKQGLKHGQLYVRLRIRPLGQQAYHVGFGYYAAAAAAIVCLQSIPYRIPDCSIRSMSFALCERQPKVPSPECSTPMEERIVEVYGSLLLIWWVNEGPRGCPCGVMVKVMIFGIVVSEFELQSRYYVHFRTNTLGNGMNPLILPAMG